MENSRKNINSLICCLVFFALSSNLLIAQSCNLLCNTDFDDVVHTSAGNWGLAPNGTMPCWRTTESSGDIEVWGSGMFGVPSYSGLQFIELNAQEPATIYQDFIVAPGTSITLGFAHRGRQGIDSMNVSIGPVGGPYVILGSYGDGNTAWGYYTVSYTIPMALGNSYSLRFTSTYAFGGSLSFGNFLDAVSIVTSHPVIVSDSTNATCFNLGNGTAAALVNGGTTPYSYSWSNTSTNQNINNLTAGTYSVIVTDANGCTAQTSVNITEPPLLQASIPTQVDVKCNGDASGSATGNAVGGTAPYYYSWSNASSSQIVTGLTAGTIQLIITDGNGCSAIASTIITEPPQLVLLNSNAVSICSGQNYSITSTASGGTPGYLYSWSNNQQIQNITVSPTQQTIYTLTVTDNNYCKVVGTVTVNVNELPIVSFTTNKREGCEPTCIEFSNTTPNTQTANWQFSSSSSQAGGIVTECYNTAGSYGVTLVITDNNGCMNSLTENSYITIHPTPHAAFTANPQQTTILNPTINFTNQSQGYSSSVWSFGDLSNISSTATNSSYTYDDTGKYEVRLMVVNVFGCSDIATDTIYITPDVSVFVPNTFTPNGDNMNEIFLPLGTGIVAENFEMIIFNRWGNIVFKSTNPSVGWDGSVAGKQAQVDTYVYRINYFDIMGTKHKLIGQVNVIR